MSPIIHGSQPRAILRCSSLLLALNVLAQEPVSPSRALADVQTKLAQARRALGAAGSSLSPEDRQRLTRAVEEADEASARYLQLLKQGDARAEAMAPLAVAGGGVALDDATGVGVADDVLLPFIGIAILVAYCRTQSPASSTELATAWEEVIRRLEALARVADQIRVARWTCVAQCNVQPIPGRAPPTFPERVFGNGDGTSEAGACENAKRSATQSAPAGTYPRHCKCDCRK